MIYLRASDIRYVPRYSSATAPEATIFSTTTIAIPPNAFGQLPTGLWIDRELSTQQSTRDTIPYLQIGIHHSLVLKGLTLPHGIDIVNFAYQNQIRMCVYNTTRDTITVCAGDKIGKICELEARRLPGCHIEREY